MRIHPTVNQVDGIVTVSLQAQYVGDATDANDQILTGAYGDPKINLGGSFVDPVDPNYMFSMGALTLMAGVVTEMHTYTAQFMVALPPPPSGRCRAIVGPLQTVTPDPVRSAGIWKEEIVKRITLAFQRLREAPTPIDSLPDSTI